MRKAILALLVISTVTILTRADKPSSVESKVVKNVAKAPNVATRPLKPRKYPIHPSQFRSPRLHRLTQKFPVHKVLSNSVRKSRKFNVSPSKKVQNVQKRKRVQKPVGGRHQARPRVLKPQAKKVHNFARFLRAFGKQLNRPVQYPRFAPKTPKIANNRRKFNIPPGKNHPIVFKKAEDIAGYEKFTLSEVVFPEAKLDDQVKEASDRADDIEPIFVDEINKVEDGDKKKAVDAKKEDSTSAQKLDIDPRIKKLDVR